MSIALVLAGHGSHISQNTAGLVWDYVDTLRSWAVADEITACFWKEQPYFNHVLNGLVSETVVIVPMFTANGFFSKQIIPAEMNLTGNLTVRNGRKIYYTRTLGQHPYLQTIVQQKVDDTLKTESLSAQNVAVAIIGHGTSRNRSTRHSTEIQVQSLQAANIVPEVVSAYLDDEPNIPSIYERTNASHIIAVPFFLAAGSHATQDIPEALGIKYGDFPAQVADRQVYYPETIGTDEAICELILQLARATGFPFERKTQKTSWSNFPLAGALRLRDRILSKGEMRFGELLLRPNEVHPIASSAELILDNPKTLRKYIRENPFRPLASRRDLRRDWCVKADSIDAIPAIVETVYPNSIQAWDAIQNNSFVPETLEILIARQKGNFTHIDSKDEAKIAHFVSSVCGRCIKTPFWYEQTRVLDAIPCASACNYLLTKLMESKNQ